MKIVLIGATGLIGRAVFQALNEAGHEVIATSRNPLNAKSKLGDFSDIRHWDGKSVPALKEILEGADGIINLAGENLASGWWTRKRKRKIAESRIGTGRLLTESVLLSDHKPSFLIQGSAAGFYGHQTGHPVDETGSGGTGFLAELTQEWESSVHLLEDAGLRVVYLRTGIVLSKDGGMLEKLLLPFRFYAGTIPGSGKQWISWIHINDLVRVILFLAENNLASGPFNVAVPENIRLSKLIRSIGIIIKRPVWIRIPGLILLAGLGQMAGETILASIRLFPAKLIKEGFDFKFENINSALRDLLAKKGV